MAGTQIEIMKTKHYEECVVTTMPASKLATFASQYNVTNDGNYTRMYTATTDPNTAYIEQ